MKGHLHDLQRYLRELPVSAMKAVNIRIIIILNTSSAILSGSTALVKMQEGIFLSAIWALLGVILNSWIAGVLFALDRHERRWNGLVPTNPGKETLR